LPRWARTDAAQTLASFLLQPVAALASADLSACELAHSVAAAQAAIGVGMREHVLLFCLLGLLLTAAIMLMIAPGSVTWALSFIQ
jgi:hypothetical protein